MRSVIMSLALAVGSLGFALATPTQARADDLGDSAITSADTMPVAYWGGRGFYRGFYPGYGGYGYYRGYYPGFSRGYYGGYYPYGYGGFSRRYYGGGFYPYGGYGGFGGWGYRGFWW